MLTTQFPVIDAEGTGKNILRLRQECGLSVRDMQGFFGFEEPRVIYMWQHGQCLPSVDNLYALSTLLGVPMNEILVSSRPQLNMTNIEQQAPACCSSVFSAPLLQLLWTRWKKKMEATNLPRPTGI